ncbi:hypothetical protein BIV57_19425 [Mangrovactinospora gilvigrisea]|uniref:Uncharacterized protein n=1 Tax=Mangrovactinospora gilvigrisea TaxID=1428644 RepID=A0A1J7BB90_9ACTN|nr:hypothetical protein [Mangrovactinospora gilvigrisea]OIV35886.1 hypothetical protein BIV57_19425 [Mangrovactinospora gilvigrisea]
MNQALVLNGEGLSRFLRDDRRVAGFIAATYQSGSLVCTSAMTVIEAASDPEDLALILGEDGAKRIRVVAL